MGVCATSGYYECTTGPVPQVNEEIRNIKYRYNVDQLRKYCDHHAPISLQILIAMMKLKPHTDEPIPDMILLDTGHTKMTSQAAE
jgi:hypothetical protein